MERMGGRRIFDTRSMRSFFAYALLRWVLGWVMVVMTGVYDEDHDGDGDG
jgi:hypothetical protein